MVIKYVVGINFVLMKKGEHQIPAYLCNVTIDQFWFSISLSNDYNIFSKTKKINCCVNQINWFYSQLKKYYTSTLGNGEEEHQIE